MPYFDLVGAQEVGQLAVMLGYKKAFLVGRDVFLENAKTALNNNKEKFIVSGGMMGMLLHAMGKGNVIGILVAGNEANKKLLAKLAENCKLLVFNASNLTCVDQKTRLYNLGTYRHLLKLAVHMKVPVAIATFAADKTCALSPAQLIGVARFLGADLDNAKGMVSVLGGRL
jgi:hypothetical protein